MKVWKPNIAKYVFAPVGFDFHASEFEWLIKTFMGP